MSNLTKAIQEARLPEHAEARLTDLVETFVATHSAPAPFTRDEQAQLRKLDSEPFCEADPAEVAALFARRG